MTALRVYRATLGLVFRTLGGCRYMPSCSRYGYEAIQRFGRRRSWSRAVKRISGCDPLQAGGWDPLP